MPRQNLPLISYLKRYFKNKILLKKSFVIEDYPLYSSFFLNKKGLEIGGPSKIFNRKIPIYQIVSSLDGCNFSKNTIWEGNINPLSGYKFFHNRIGKQYISEANYLSGIPDGKYDFIISSHCLEHCANIIKTLKEWLRVIKLGGAILIILPEKKYTFDHHRPVTSFQHLLEDYNSNVGESDLQHLNEILELHDLNLDLAAGTPEEFEERSNKNYENRCLHHHVFDFKLIQDIFNYLNIEVVNQIFEKPHHNIVLGIKR